MADSSQTRIRGRLTASSCMLVGGCRVRFPFLGAQARLHFGQAKVWAEDDWDAARVFCPLPPARVFLCGFMPLCLELTTGFSH